MRDGFYGKWKKIASTSVVFAFLAAVTLVVLDISAIQTLGLKTAMIMGENKLKGDLASFESALFREYGELRLKDNELVDEQGNSIKYHYSVVDRISKDLGIEATIFTKEYNSYRRITTSIINRSGNRMIDTFLDESGVAYSLIQSGEKYIGEADVLGNNYLSVYKPLFQPNTNEVIGILFIGINMKVIEDIIASNRSSHVVKIIILIICILVGLVILNFISRLFFIRDSNKLIGTIFDAMPLSSNIWNKNHENIETNLESVRMFELSSKKEYFDRFYDLSPEYQPNGKTSREMAFEKINKAFEEGFQKFEWMHQKFNGEQIPCEVTLVRIEFQGTYAVAGYTRDLREQKAKLREMRRAELADEANKAKSKFLAVMSHEIRTPMNMIIGITEGRLQEETLSPDLKESFARIYNAGHLLLQIVNDLLDLSQIEANKLEIVCGNYEIADVINDAVQLNMARIGNKPIKFILNVDENIPSEFNGDELRIKQILNNILSNAFKYTKRGEVIMSVMAETREDSDNAKLVFCISDTGQGMTAEQKRRIFDEYARFNLRENRLIEGTGLGMSITQNLINLMSGSISIESEFGKGSEFTISLPQKIVIRDALGKFNLSSSALSKKIQLVRNSFPDAKILVVDDVETNLYVAKKLLEPYGFAAIDTVESGTDAIEKVKNGIVYDIILMDHMMPKMDGIEATKIIRELDYKHPIIALTANVMASHAELFLKSGFDDFIPKPIDIHLLNAKLNKFIKNESRK
ncbi:MAG: cache domain-containing protein [Fibromonadales bacterium]|nr:cache domain-containing protein [Fibromonadales bacterium]